MNSDLILEALKSMTISELHEAVLDDPPFIDVRLVNYQCSDPQKYRYFAKLVRRLKPKCVVELGTGTGRTAAMIMATLPKDSRFITINWPNPPSGDEVGKELRPWVATGDKRLLTILGDTREVSGMVPDGIDLLYIDSGTTHEYTLISAEWELYRPKLAEGAIVVCDDIHFAGSDMERFWEPLPYEKLEILDRQVGMFRFTKDKP